MTELPKGWALATVHELAETSLGKMLDAKQQTGEYPTSYLRNINVRWGSFDLSDVAEMDVAPHELDRVLAQPGDVIACEGGEPGRAAVWRGEPIAIQKALHRIRPAAGISSDYVAYGLRAAASTKQLDRLFTGTTIKHLPQEKLRLVQIALAPTAEQERIVTAIEEAFSKLDAGEAGLRTVRQLLKRMRDAILTAAVTGRLVPQDPTDTPAAKLLADLGAEPADAPVSMPAGWCHARLGTIVSVVSGNTPKDLADALSSTGEVPFIKVGDLALSDRVLANSRTWVSRADKERLKLRTCPSGTIVFPKRGGAIATNRKRVLGCEAAFDLNTMGLVPRAGLGDWVWTWINNIDLQSISDGSNIPQVNHTDVDPLLVPLPPPQEQSRIVAEVDRQMSFLEACERAVEAGLTRSAALRRSVLKAAFEGRLVPQDPSDEPASVLLERIRAESSAQPVAKRRARQTA